MDYLQSLEFQLAALQRKIRLLQDLRFFAETASPEELAAFGDELRATTTASGSSLGSILAGLLLGSAGKAVAPNAAPRPAGNTAAAPPGAAISTGAANDDVTPAAPEPPRAETAAVAPDVGSADTLAEVRASIDAAMRPIPGGSFVMGSDAADAEKPQHKASLAPYRLCDHLVTNREYALFIAANPQWAKDRADPESRDDHYLEDWGESGYPEGKGDCPVAFVPYAAACAFAAWLGKRLPTEAEWECGARGGLAGKKYPNGDQMNDKLANLAKQYRGTTPVRTFEPNGFGLYDMAGNLFEWCSDWFGPYSPAEAANPEGPASGDYRVVRGGSWMSGATALRVSARVDMEETTCGQVGIRLADDG
jgi:Uncharacterized conserved protein